MSDWYQYIWPKKKKPSQFISCTHVASVQLNSPGSFCFIFSKLTFACQGSLWFMSPLCFFFFFLFMSWSKPLLAGALKWHVWTATVQPQLNFNSEIILRRRRRVGWGRRQLLQLCYAPETVSASSALLLFLPRFPHLLPLVLERRSHCGINIW